MKKIVTLVAVSVISSVSIFAENAITQVPFNEVPVIKIKAPVKTDIITDSVAAPVTIPAQTLEVTVPKVKTPEVTMPEIKAPEVNVSVEKAPEAAPKAEMPIANKPMMDGKGPHGNMRMMKRPDGPMPHIGIKQFKKPMMNHQQATGSNRMRRPQGRMPSRMMGNQQARMPAMNAPQGMMPMMGQGGAPMMPNQGFYMPMMNMQMMQQKQAMMEQHKKTMENRLANIEALLKELVELQKAKK